MRGLIIGLAIVFGFGFALGGIGQPDPEVKYKVIHDTETVTVTETKEVLAPIPDACFDMYDIARDVLKSSAKLDGNTTDVLDIMSNTRIAVATGDSNEINVLETELRGIISSTVDQAESFGLDAPDLKAAAKACKEGTQ